MAGVQPVVAGGKVYIGTLRGVVHAIDAETGKEAWTFRAGGAVLHACAVDGGKVFFGAADGRICAINSADGKPAWSVSTGSAVWNAPAVYDGTVFCGSRDGKLYAIDAVRGEVKWRGQTAGPILCSSAIDAKLARVYVGSEDMHVYAFDIASGRQIWRSGKLPGASMRGYHPVIAPDGSVMVTVTPVVCSDTIQSILLDMAKEVFGDFASWRHKKDENDRLRKENFALMNKPETYQKQLDYIRKRLTEQPAFQTFFVLDPANGKQKFVAPIVHAESMNGPGSPPIVTSEGKVIVKYSALLRSRYEHYSPFLNVGYLDTKTGHITPTMDQSRTYGWHDSLLLVHDEQAQLSAGGRVLFNTHQDNVNAMDLDTLEGYGEPMCWGVHEVKGGVAASIWADWLHGKPLPMGWEWFARGTAVYGGGSAIDVPIAIAGDSFYYLPTHEINAGVVLVACKMQSGGSAARKSPEPTEKLTADDWPKVRQMNWDWDLLTVDRLKPTLTGLPQMLPGTRQRPLAEEANAAVEKITDDQLDQILWQALAPAALPRAKEAERLRTRLDDAVGELISTDWRPMQFPAGKAPGEAYRFFVDPTETLYTLALAYPHLRPQMQEQVRARVAELSSGNGPLAGLTGRKTYDAKAGEVRTLFDPVPDSLMRIVDDLTRSDLARLYPLWLWANASGDWARLERDWPKLKGLVTDQPAKGEADCGNSRIAGLIAACRIARKLDDEQSVRRMVPIARKAMRERLIYEFSYTEGGLINQANGYRTIFGRWRFLTPEVGHLLQQHARGIHQRLMEVYVDYHRPTWWLAWNVELMWRNEANFIFPTAAAEVFSARAMVLAENGESLARYVDEPWCKGDEYRIQKLAMVLNNLSPAGWK